MKKVAPIALAAAAFALPSSSGADDFAFRVKPAGLDALEDAARAMLPEEITLDDMETDVFGCAIHISDGIVDALLEKLDLQAQAGALRADILLDLAASAEVDVCSGLMTCDVFGCAKPVAAALEVALDTSASGWIEVAGVEVDLALAPGQFDVDISGCSAGSLLSAILSAFDGWVLERLRPRVESFIAGRIADRVADLISEALPRRLERGDLAIEARLSRLDIDSELGFTVAGTAAVSVLGATSPGPPTRAPEGDPLPREHGPGDFAVAASDRLVNRALHAAWEAGLLDLALADLAPSITLSERGLAQQLGLPSDSAVDLAIDLGAAPQAAFARGAEGIHIRLEGLVVDLAVAAPGERTETIEIAADASLRADVEVGRAGAFILKPLDLEVTRLELTGESSQFSADPARLAAFLGDVGVPMLADRLADLPLAPALRPTDGLYVWMRRLEADGGWLRAGLDLVVPDPSDTRPPSTELLAPPRVVPAGMTRIPVKGDDDTTPAPLLRYVATLDGEPIAPEPQFWSAIPISAADGEYTLEVAAVDLVGNVDPDPVKHRLVVDGVPPSLDVLDAPGHTVGNTAYASWRATDDRGVVSTRWELLELADGDTIGRTAREGEAGPEGEVSLDGLSRQTHYVLRITAVDEAGNVTSEDFGFVRSGGGCAAGGGGAIPSVLIVLGALVFIDRRRWCRSPAAAAAIALFATFALATPASAQGIGTHFSGPTDADGASAFWNPAAMMRGHGTRLDAASGLSLIRMRFDSDSGERSRTFVPKPEPTVGGYTDVAGRDWRLGFTVGLPQIDGATWPRDDGAGDVTRYYATSARYYHLTATPAVAYRARPWLSIGGGVRVVRSQMVAELDKDIGSELNMTLGSSDPDAPLPYAEPVLAAPTELSASGWGVGLVAGALITPDAPVTIGVGVHTPSTSKGSGEVSAEYPQPMRDFVAEAAPEAELPELAGDVTADLEMPLMAFTSVAVEPADDWEIVVDYRFIRRSQVANTDLIVSESTSPNVDDTAVVRDYRDRHSIGLRAAHRLRDAGVVAALRARYENNSVPEQTVSPSNVDFHKVEIGGAAAWSVTERVLLIGQYSRYFLASRQIDDSLHRPLAEPSLASFNKPSPTGTYSGTSDYLTLGASMFW